MLLDRPEREAGLSHAAEWVCCNMARVRVIGFRRRLRVEGPWRAVWARLVPAASFADRATEMSFRGELASAAISRLPAFAVLLVVVHVPLALRDVWASSRAVMTAEQSWERWLLAMHVSMVFVSCGYLFVLRWRLRARRRVRFAYSFLVFLLLWSAWLAGVDQLIDAGITVYMMIILSAALFITFDGAATAAAFLAAGLAFAGGQVTFQQDQALLFSNLVNGGGLTLTAWLFSRMLYQTKATAFVQRATITAQRRQLEAANGQLSATLHELTQLNGKLNRSVALLERERQRSDELLGAVLPSRIVDRLKRGEAHIADAHRDVLVLYADLAGFTRLGSELRAPELVELLDRLFSAYDGVVQRFGLEKIKTVGDAYLAAAGLQGPPPSGNGLFAAVADAALEIRAVTERFALEFQRPLAVRIGLARGDVVGGVLGKQRLLYDIWGDAVNVASRLEASAEPSEVLVTAPIAERLAMSHRLGPMQRRTLKGKGEVELCALLGRADGPDSGALSPTTGAVVRG